MLAKLKSLSVLLVVVKNMKGYKMKKNEITCDLCGVTVAEKDDTWLSSFKTKIPYIKVPYNYIGVDYCYSYVFPCNAKKDFHICENCLERIKKRFKRSEKERN